MHNFNSNLVVNLQTILIKYTAHLSGCTRGKLLFLLHRFKFYIKCQKTFILTTFKEKVWEALARGSKMSI